MTAEVRTNETEPVRLTGSLDSPRLTGKLTIEQGSMVFPTARFTIDRGSEIELRYPFYAVATSDPSLGIVLDVTARTRLSATSDISGQRRRYTIIVEARGPLNDNAPLQITDTTDPTVNPFNYRGLRLTFRSILRTWLQIHLDSAQGHRNTRGTKTRADRGPARRPVQCGRIPTGIRVRRVPA